MSDEQPDEHVIDVIADELGLARAQLDAGLTGLAEGTVRRRLARLEADGAESADDELDALHLLLAETLWRQQRHVAARAALDAIRTGSGQRRLPIAMLVDAETLAAAGEADRAAGAQERLVAAVGIDEAHALRGRRARPAVLAAAVRARRRGPAAGTPAVELRPGGAGRRGRLDGRRRAGGRRRRARMEDARVAYVAGDRQRGDGRMSIALRLDPGLAADGVKIIEPTLGRQPSAERLVLYGDLLRAAGREAEAQRAYGRAAERRS